MPQITRFRRTQKKSAMLLYQHQETFVSNCGELLREAASPPFVPPQKLLHHLSTVVSQGSGKFDLHGGQDDRWDAPVSPSTPPRKAQRNYTTALTIIVDISAAGKEQNSFSGSDHHKNHRNRWSASSSCQDRAISIPRRYSLVNTNSSSRWYETLDLDDLPMQPTLRQPSMLLSSILSKSPATGSIASV